MRDVALRLPAVATTLPLDDDLSELLNAVSTALLTAADLKQQFEQSED